MGSRDGELERHTEQSIIHNMYFPVRIIICTLDSNQTYIIIGDKIKDKTIAKSYLIDTCIN